MLETDLKGEVASEELVLQLSHHEVPVLQQAAHAPGHCMADSPLPILHGHLAPAGYDGHRVTAEGNILLSAGVLASILSGTPARHI